MLKSASAFCSNRNLGSDAEKRKFSETLFPRNASLTGLRKAFTRLDTISSNPKILVLKIILAHAVSVVFYNY